MALNEAPPYSSNLTQAQQRQAESAIYGLPEVHMSNTITAEEIEKMRALVQSHDREHNRIQEFDLNKPPTPPYRYQEFPRMLYHHRMRTTCIVRNTLELEAREAEGWSKEPFPTEAEAPELDAASAAEAAAMDIELRKPKPKK